MELWERPSLALCHRSRRASDAGRPADSCDGTQQDARDGALDVGTITGISSKPGVSEPRTSDVDGIRRRFESAGVEFIDENGGGPGVRLRKRQLKRGEPSDTQ